MAELTHDDVQRIIQIIDEMGDRDVCLEIGELKLHVTRGGGAAGPTQTPRAPVSALAAAPVKPPAAIVEVPPGHVAIRAPTMGTFYRASSPGAKPHTDIGNRVQPDDTVGVFEVMKLFSTLKAGTAGTVTAIPAANEAIVEQDQVLVIIKPDR
ncbi:MAG: biotin carboxyl carrier protein [Betaproteobacteria bacterium]|nr:biotin carboxyl carrier protein [Betaproteobacteria bacterium]